MLTFRNYLLIIKSILFLSILTDIYIRYKNSLLIMILLFVFATIIITNDYLRNIRFKDHTKYVHISLFFSLCTSSILIFTIDGISTYFYYYSFLFEIFQFKRNMLKFFIPIHVLLLSFYAIGLKSYNLNSISYFLIFILGLLSYLSIFGMLYNKRKLEMESKEVKQLNEKLRLANVKLQECSLEIEEVAISKERTRVSQELHDSLGHSLVALVMHLEFAKNICTTNPLKLEEILAQSEKIARAGINDLRKTVDLLKSEPEVQDLNASLEQLINNFYLFSNLKITYTKSTDIESLNPILKTSIYKTIQESITNSLKHGNATKINIEIIKNIDNVKVIITDNGIGCDNVLKSNGLNGIENRINSLGGEIYYFSHNNLGFGIKLFIPI